MQQPSDEQLARRAARGDRAAFASLYERHFDGLYDFATRTTRDRDLAADIVQTSFIRAWRILREGGDIRTVRAWLYSVARNAAIDELRHRRRVIAAPSETLDRPDERADAQHRLEERELADLVWEAAAELESSEHSLLDLHVRRGLSADEMAGELGISRGAVYTRLSRARDAFEDALVATLLLRHGRDACSELAALGQRSASRGELIAHARDCASCRRSRARHASAGALLAGITAAPASAAVRARIWSGVGRAIDAYERPRGPATVVATVVSLLLAAVASGYAATPTGESGRSAEVSETRTQPPLRPSADLDGPVRTATARVVLGAAAPADVEPAGAAPARTNGPASPRQVAAGAGAQARGRLRARARLRARRRPRPRGASGAWERQRSSPAPSQADVAPTVSAPPASQPAPPPHVPAPSPQSNGDNAAAIQPSAGDAPQAPPPDAAQEAIVNQPPPHQHPPGP